MMIRCWDCGQVKPEDQFPRDRSRADGRSHRCRVCKNFYQRAYRAANAWRLRPVWRLQKQIEREARRQMTGRDR